MSYLFLVDSDSPIHQHRGQVQLFLPGLIYSPRICSTCFWWILTGPYINIEDRSLILTEKMSYLFLMDSDSPIHQHRGQVQLFLPGLIYSPIICSTCFWWILTVPYINTEDRYKSSYQVLYIHKEYVLLVSGGF